MREPVKSLMTKYDDPKNFDALSRAQSSMDELKDIAAQNINKMMQNQQNLTVLAVCDVHMLNAVPCRNCRIKPIR
jgi:hypothetical protein